MADCINALKEWTGKASAAVVYDSTVDEFTHDGIFNKVKGKRNVAVIGFTTDGDVFGGFYSVAVTKQDERFMDPDMFAFSFESHGRCMTPQKFAVYGVKQNANVSFWKNDREGFVWFGMYYGGDCGFDLGDERSDSCCWDMLDAFEGLENTTLTGNVDHHCARLVAVQLE